MKRFLIPVLCAAVLLSSCSKRERSSADEAEWAEIEALANGAEGISAGQTLVADAEPETPPPAEFAPFYEKLAAMRAPERAAGETLLTGGALEFDYEKRFARITNNVVIVDDRGVLKADELIGRMTMSNEFGFAQAIGAVEVNSEGRRASADEAIYNHKDGFLYLKGAVHASVATNSIAGDDVKVWISEENELEKVVAKGRVKIVHGKYEACGESGFYDALNEFALLEGRAMVSSDVNSVSCERIQAWISTGAMKLICEPNVVVEVSGEMFAVDGVLTETNEISEIRGERFVYEEAKRYAELVGNVKLRNSRAAMNCEIARLYLKEDNEIDWFEAVGEVIIQIGGIEKLPSNVEYVKALAGRATYRASENMFTLEEEPKVKAGPNVMSGEGINFWMNPWRLVCEPQARILLYLDEETKAKFLKDLDK